MTMIVTGATGFIGRHLLAQLLAEGVTVRALTRSTPPSDLVHPKLTWIVGDFQDSSTWDRLLLPGCTVFNLAHSFGSIDDKELVAIRRILGDCSRIGIRRFVHCSTVSIYGRVRERVVTETTPCDPRDSYGQIKRDIDRALFDRSEIDFECAILRPTNVFGAGGIALKKEMADLLHDSPLVSYARASLFGKRRAHFVPVQTVVAALIFLASVRLQSATEAFIVSDDDAEANNFCDVEAILRNAMDKGDPWLPPFPLPSFILEALLRARGRANVNSRTVYSSAKLLSRGFRRPVEFSSALRDYARLSLVTELNGGTRP